MACKMARLSILVIDDFLTNINKFLAPPSA